MTSHDRYQSLIPQPRRATAVAGTLELGPDTVLVAGPGAEEAAAAVRVLLGSLRLPLPPSTGVDAAADATAVTVRLDAAVERPEGYRLRVDPAGVEIAAADLDGVRHACQTLRQLLPDDVWRAAPRPGTRWHVPCGEVTDAPALPWRGAMLDVSRYFFPKRAVLRYIDLLAMHRFNRLHLHLTDDQGWRIESRRHPELHQMGSHRPHTQLGRKRDGRNDGTPHGGYYPLEDLAEIAAYASERGVTVVPEIDLPGHASSLLASRPELGTGTDQVLTGWGISPGVLKPVPATVALLTDVLEELLDAVPTPYVHLGGDECVLEDWPRDPEVADAMRAAGVADPIGMHGHFLRQLGGHLAGRGVRMVVWDEAFVTGGVLEDSVVMAWRGDSVARRAAAAGYDVVRAPVFPTYLNYDQSDLPEEPLSQGGPIRLADVAAFAPAPREWSEEERARVLGTQFQAWSEYIPHERYLDYMMFPRACALAEVAWTGGPTAIESLEQRLGAHLARLDAAGVEYRPLDGPHPWQTGGTGDRRRQTGSTMAAERVHHEELSQHAAIPADKARARS